MTELTTMCYDGTTIRTFYDPNYLGTWDPERIYCIHYGLDDSYLLDWEWADVGDTDGLDGYKLGDVYWDYANSVECEEQIAELHRDNVNSYNEVNGGRRL